MSLPDDKNKKDVHYVSHKDLPVSCPPQGVEVWNMHPRVYLPIEDVGSVICPYCSAKYILKD